MSAFCPNRRKSDAAEFESWAELYKILEPNIPPLSEITDPFMAALWIELLLQIVAKKQAKQYLTGVHNNLGRQRRRLFILDSKYIGTGPPDLVIVDRVFLLVGVPVPMALRSNSESSDENLRAVEAVIVHGLLHAEGFQESKMREVVLV